MIPAIIAGVAALGAAAANAYSSHEALDATNKGARNAANQTASAWDSLSRTYDKNASTIQGYANKVNSVYDDKTLAQWQAAYKQALATDPSSLTYTPTDFDYTKSVEDFYDRAWQTNSDAQMRALERSAANAGQLYSSALQSNIAGQVSRNANNAYEAARNAYLSDKGLELNKWQAENTNLANQASQNLSAYNTRTTNLGNGLASALSAQGQIAQAQIGNNNAAAQSWANLLAAYTNQVANAGDYGTRSFAQFQTPSSGSSKLY